MKMDNATAINNRRRGREEQPRPCIDDEGESTRTTSPATKIAIENELKAWLSRPKPRSSTDAPQQLRPYIPPSTPGNRYNSPRSGFPTTNNSSNNVSPSPTASSSTPTSNKHNNSNNNNNNNSNNKYATDDKFVKTIANAMQMKQRGKLTHPPPPPPQTRRNINNNNNDNHNNFTASTIDTIIQQRDDDIINNRKHHRSTNGKEHHHHHRSNSSSSSLPPSSNNKHRIRHHNTTTTNNIIKQQQQQLPIIKNDSNKQGVFTSSPDYNVLTFDQFKNADSNNNKNNNGYHSDSSYVTTCSAPVRGYNNNSNHPIKIKPRRKKGREEERACDGGVLVSSPTWSTDGNNEEDDDDAGSQTSRTSQKSFSSVFTTLKSYLRKGSNGIKGGGSNGYYSDGGLSHNRRSINNQRRGSKAVRITLSRKKSTKYRSTNDTSVSADKYNNFGMSETDVTRTTVDSYSNGSPVPCGSSSKNNGNKSPSDDNTSRHNKESGGGTNVFDFPWTDVTSSHYSSNSTLHGLYTGPVNNQFKPNGSGTLILRGNKFLKFYGIWDNGILVTNLMNEDEMKLHHDWTRKKKKNRILDGYDSSASSSCSSRMSNRSSRSDVSYRKSERIKGKKDNKKKKKKKKKKEKPSKGEGYNSHTTNNRLLYVRSSRHPQQQQYANQHSSTLATEYDDPTTTSTTTNSNRTKNGVHKPSKRRVQRYTLGEVARTPRDMVILRSDDKAIEWASTLKKYDQAFLKRSNGLWTCSVLADRSLQPITTSSSSHWYTSDEIDENNDNVEFEESMLFVIDEDGATKIIKKRHWGRFVRCMQKNDNEHATAVEGGEKGHGNDSIDASMQSFRCQVKTNERHPRKRFTL